MRRDFYVRQLWDWKGSADVETHDPAGMRVLRRGPAAGRSPGPTPAPGTASPSPSYLGTSDAFDRAIAEFAEAYADQNERDHSALLEAVTTGRVVAHLG